MAVAGAEASRPTVKSYRSALVSAPSVPARVDISYGKMNDFPAVFISDEDMAELAKPFNLTLIGKFLVDRPSLADIRKFVVRMKFFAFVKVDNHDLRNVVFRFADEQDYMRFFARRNYTIFGIEMRVSKWSPFVDVTEELPIMPLWVAFPGLRFQLYHLKTIMDIAAVIGKPLCVDSNTASQGSLAQARVLVEVDVSVEHPKWVWIGSQERGALQAVNIENLPQYCSSCKKVGHELSDCKVNGKVAVGGEATSSPPTFQWVPKQVSIGLDGTLGQEQSHVGQCNHPNLPLDANFSNYKNYDNKVLEEQTNKNGNGNLTNMELTSESTSHLVSTELGAGSVGVLGDPPLIPSSSSPPSIPLDGEVAGDEVLGTEDCSGVSGAATVAPRARFVEGFSEPLMKIITSTLGDRGRS